MKEQTDVTELFYNNLKKLTEFKNLGSPENIDPDKEKSFEIWCKNQNFLTKEILDEIENIRTQLEKLDDARLKLKEIVSEISKNNLKIDE